MGWLLSYIDIDSVLSLMFLSADLLEGAIKSFFLEKKITSSLFFPNSLIFNSFRVFEYEEVSVVIIKQTGAVVDLKCRPKKFGVALE